MGGGGCAPQAPSRGAGAARLDRNGRVARVSAIRVTLRPSLARLDVRRPRPIPSGPDMPDQGTIVLYVLSTLAAFAALRASSASKIICDPVKSWETQRRKRTSGSPEVCAHIDHRWGKG